MRTQPVSFHTLRRIVELAVRAPSVHNTQPWCWRGTNHSLDLYADRTRQLRASDPAGRDLVISCGAALHHAQVAAAAWGWASEVDRHPAGASADLLARIRLAPSSPSPHAQTDLAAIRERRTDRRRFTAWPVPDGQVSRLASTANACGAEAVPLLDVSDRFRVERLVDHATQLRQSVRPMAEEQQRWVDHSDVDGVPSSTLSQLHGAHRAGSRLQETLDDIGGAEIEGSDGLIVLLDADDDAEAWLRAGEGLSALWLAATTDGLSVVPLSHVVEVDETREAFRRDVLRGMAHPLLLVRIGWQAMGRGRLERTPRRSVDDVLSIDWVEDG